MGIVNQLDEIGRLGRTQLKVTHLSRQTMTLTGKLILPSIVDRLVGGLFAFLGWWGESVPLGLSDMRRQTGAWEVLMAAVDVCVRS